MAERTGEEERTSRVVKNERKVMLGFIYERAPQGDSCSQLRPMLIADTRALYMEVSLAPWSVWVATLALNRGRDSVGRGNGAGDEMEGWKRSNKRNNGWRRKDEIWNADDVLSGGCVGRGMHWHSAETQYHHQQGDLVAETPATRKTKTAVMISTTGSLRQQSKPDLITGREISSPKDGRWKNIVR
ncbi:hypothetical protein ACLOJK_005105 [Asimina triloba]